MKTKKTNSYEVAAWLGLSNGYFSNILSGTRRPSLQVMRKIKEKTGASLDFIDESSSFELADFLFEMYTSCQSK